jgi:hypothetical protein
VVYRARVRSLPLTAFAAATLATLLLATASPGCSAGSTKISGKDDPGDGAGGSSSAGGSSGVVKCNECAGAIYHPCDEAGSLLPEETCPAACSKGLGCTDCQVGSQACVGNDIHVCGDDGKVGGVVQTCDSSMGQVCSDGACVSGCEKALAQPSNVGCEFWAVDLDQQDGGNDPASAPWGIVLSNAGDIPASVTIELNEAPLGEPVKTAVVKQLTIMPNELAGVLMPTRELDCGVKPNDYLSPGTCLSSNAFRISSNAPIVAYQFNTAANSFSNDASLLLPTSALGKVYRAIGWPAGHPVLINFPGLPPIIDRSYVTIVGTVPNTTVKVRPTWRVKGNPPIAPTGADGVIEVTLGPFDVLNLETDDATLAEGSAKGTADLTGTIVESSAPVAVFSGTESTSAPYGLDIPTYPGWSDKDTCCLDHLEDQLFPLESIGKRYVVTRSPIRSKGSYHEPDVLRFVGAAAPATVTTTLPPPFDSFTIQPGEIRDTWADRDVLVTSTEPVLIGQLLISQGYVEGATKGDPSLTVFPPVEQQRTEYVFLTPGSWLENWVVIATEKATKVTIDGAEPGNCVVTSIGTLDSKDYESRRCPLGEGVHRLSGSAGFGIIAYGYGSAGSYAFAGGADVKKIYEPPIIK